MLENNGADVVDRCNIGASVKTAERKGIWDVERLMATGLRIPQRWAQVQLRSVGIDWLAFPNLLVSNLAGPGPGPDSKPPKLGFDDGTFSPRLSLCHDFQDGGRGRLGGWKPVYLCSATLIPTCFWGAKSHELLTTCRPRLNRGTV